jgi:hypothetical protein
MPRAIFTTHNAAEMAKRSAKARARNAQAAIERMERLTAIAQDIAPAAPEYVAKRLDRVRAQLSKIDTMLEEEIDPAKLDRLAACQARLAEQERLLAGRPLPGSNRPAKASRRQPIQDIQPIPAMIEPVPVVPSKPLGWEYD